MEQYVALINQEAILFSAEDDQAAIAICMTNKNAQEIELQTQDGRFVEKL